MRLLIEQYSINAWPATKQQLYDGWLLRYSGGYTKRANSISPLYDSHIPITEKITHCEREYTRNGLPAIYKIPDIKRCIEIDRVLEDSGYTKNDETFVMLADLTTYTDNYPAQAIIDKRFATPWIQFFARCTGLDPIKTRCLAHILHNIVSETVVVSIMQNNTLVGAGYGAIEDDYIGIFDIIVDEQNRGQGIGEALVRCILGQGKQRKISKAYLQVLKGNVPAERLYDKLGFKPLYSCWFRAK